MAEQKTNNPAVAAESNSQGAAEATAKSVYGQRRNQGSARGGSGRSGDRGRGRGGRDQARDDMEQRILEIARVTRVMAGGKRMNFRACVAIGDKKGSIGVGLGKGADVTMAVNKAVNRAKKDMVKVVTVNDTIPHEVRQKLGAARVMLKPAKQGRGVIAGGVTRIILELSGVKNVTSKTLGSNNKVNNARCTLEALRSLHRSDAKEKTEAGKEKEVSGSETKK